MDFRSHKMVDGGFACVGTFRKNRSSNSIKSKYVSIVRTAEEIQEDEERERQAMQIEKEEEMKPVKVVKRKPVATIDDITMTMDSKLSISKKKTTEIQSKTITKEKKKKHAKRSQKIVKF